ncbi:hypothetical protein [Spirosoma lituiforme]
MKKLSVVAFQQGLSTRLVSVDSIKPPALWAATGLLSTICAVSFTILFIFPQHLSSFSTGRSANVY